MPVSGGNILQGPAGPCPAPVGDDARIVPETLRWREAPAAGEIARPTKPPRVGSNAQTPAIRQARRGAWCQPRRILARQGAAPLRRLGRHLPLQGRLYRRQSPQSLPCKGRWMRRKAQTEGCIAGLRRKYPARFGRTLPCLRRGRCLHRPGNLAMPQDPRRRAKSPALHCGHKQVPARKRQPSARPAGGPMQASAPTKAASAGRAAACRSQSRRPYALHCRAGVHARWGGLGRGDAVVLRKRRTARPGRSEAARKGIGKGWEPAPTGPAADKPSAVTPAGSKFRW